MIWNSNLLFWAHLLEPRLVYSQALYMMSQHSDVEARVLAEVLAVLGPDGQPSYEDITDKLPYCTAVIQEVPF